MKAVFLYSLLGCWAGAFLFQAFGERHWMVAFERAYFQTFALLLFAGLLWLNGHWNR